jgi:hypothetical protein
MKGKLMRKLIGVAVILATLLLWPARATEFEEVAPYAFAKLPHGTVYKTVHQGCEIFIVESVSWPYGEQVIYSIATGRGCK